MLYRYNDIVAVNDIHNETVGIGIIVDRTIDAADEKYCVRFNSGNPITINRRSIKKLYTLRGDIYEGFAYTMRDIIRRLGRGTYMTEQEFGKYQDEWLKSRSDSSPSRPYYFYDYRYDPKPMGNMYPVKSSLKDTLEDVNKRAVERIAASPIRIDIDDAIKANYSKEEIKKMVNNTFGVPEFVKRKKFAEMFEEEIKGLVFYKKIIFNGPCTIVLWADGTKTIAKLYEDIDKFDPEKGVAICFMKKILGHTETNKILRKATKQYAEDRKESNGDLIEKIKEAVKDAPDAIKYHLYTGEEIKVSADKNIGEIFFDDTKEEDKE